MEAKWLWVLQYWFVVPALVISFPEHWRSIKANLRPFYWWWWPLIKWLWWWWPVIVVLLIAICNYELYRFLDQVLHIPKAKEITYKCSSTLFEAIGTLGVVASLSSNLKVFKRETVLSAIHLWYRSFPFKRRTITVISDLKCQFGISGKATIITTSSTIEGEILQLKQQIEVLRETYEESKRDLIRLDKELMLKLAEAKERITDLENKIINSAIGGSKLQLLFFLLGIYGYIIAIV